MSDRPPFGTSCYGRSATGRCKTRTRWITTQAAEGNPIYACGRHLAWLIALRTSPGASITVTRMADKRLDDPAHSQSSGSGVGPLSSSRLKDDHDAVSRPPVVPAPLPE